MVDVNEWSSNLICICLPLAALSALTESSHVLINPVEKDMKNSLSQSLSNGLASSTASVS